RDWSSDVCSSDLFIAAITLPMAVIPTFVFLRVFGGSVNLMSMGGLAVAIGLVIDDAVVVVENIHRRAFEGPHKIVDAVQQLMAPLTSSTLTTVFRFSPWFLQSCWRRPPCCCSIRSAPGSCPRPMKADSSST